MSTKITKIADMTAEALLALKEALKAGTTQKDAAEQHNVSIQVVRMASLQMKQELASAEGSLSTGGSSTTDGVEGTAEAKGDSRKEKLLKLKQQIPVQETTNTSDDKPKRARKPRAKVDDTTREVLMVTSESAKIAWLTSHLQFKGKDDAWIKKDLLRIANSRKGDTATNLTNLAEAEDIKIERSEAVAVGEHEAIMAANWDKFEQAGLTLIGRRPAGFKKVAATKPKKEKETVDDIDAQIAALRERQERMNVSTEEQSCEGASDTTQAESESAETAEQPADEHNSEEATE